MLSLKGLLFILFWAFHPMQELNSKDTLIRDANIQKRNSLVCNCSRHKFPLRNCPRTIVYFVQFSLKFRHCLHAPSILSSASFRESHFGLHHERRLSGGWGMFWDYINQQTIPCVTKPRRSLPTMQILGCSPTSGTQVYGYGDETPVIIYISDEK